MLLLPFIIFILIIIFFLSVKIVQEYDRGVIFRLGRYTGVRGPGLILLIPFIETMTKVTLRTITMAIPFPKDNHKG
jgi:regulator of protease activity HflC (stomatin/prohibitin superfamily)